MVRHVVAFRFAEGVTEGQRQALETELATMRPAIPEIQQYRYGPDLGLAEGNFDFVVVADFADAAAFEVYAAHDAHQALIRDVIRPLITERVAVQYALG